MRPRELDRIEMMITFDGSALKQAALHYGLHPCLESNIRHLTQLSMILIGLLTFLSLIETQRVVGATLITFLVLQLVCLDAAIGAFASFGALVLQVIMDLLVYPFFKDRPVLALLFCALSGVVLYTLCTEVSSTQEAAIGDDGRVALPRRRGGGRRGGRGARRVVSPPSSSSRGGGCVARAGLALVASGALALAALSAAADQLLLPGWGPTSRVHKELQLMIAQKRQMSSGSFVEGEDEDEESSDDDDNTEEEDEDNDVILKQTG